MARLSAKARRAGVSRRIRFSSGAAATPTDFELKCEYRITATNSGVQFRSVQLPAGGDIGKWVMKGYQADIDYQNQFTGQIYEERGRGFLAMRGQTVYVANGERPRVIGTLERSAGELKSIIKPDDWNQIHIIARGHTITQILNGSVTSLLIDDDVKNRMSNGLSDSRCTWAIR